MFSKNDIRQLKTFGIEPKTIEEQLRIFRSGINYPKIDRAASVGDGIVRLDDDERCRYTDTWAQYLTDDRHRAVKFVPASGAASRMFKDLFEYIEKEEPTQFVGKFFNDIEFFAFYDLLDEKCQEVHGKGLEELLIAGEFTPVLRLLLEEQGLNYGNLPKGLLLFHRYHNERRTPMLEHLVEGVQYARGKDNTVRLHFTVSPEHRRLFAEHLTQNIDKYEERYGVRFDVSFSEQKKSTDTIAADTHNEPFRDEDGSLVLRPAGHGALIENLNELDADIVFIKNIDNVVPDHLKETTAEWKKAIAGYAVNLQQQAFEYLRELENPDITEAKLQVIDKFCQSRLFNYRNAEQLDREDKRAYLRRKLDRPMRVCGMVKNEGEPGGGPYLVHNADGTVSPQILEASQINTADDTQRTIMEQATHFNPVDLVCCPKDYKGRAFDLRKYVDGTTCFISTKSKGGRELKALELPGLWNGAMADWNTVFVEVPLATFNPVKNVNDLLRPEHQ